MEPLHISWKQYINDLELLCIKMIDRGFRDKRVLAIARGGLVPGVYLSHAFSATTLDIAHCTGYIGSAKLPKVLLQPPLSYTLDKAPNDVVVIDDLIDTGDTLETVAEWLESLGFSRDRSLSDVGGKITLAKRYSIAVIYDKFRSDRKVVADVVGRVLPDNQWVIFPYEVEEGYNWA